MVVVYDKKTGAIKHTIDLEYSAEDLDLKGDEEALVTLVEHENAVSTLRVDLETKTLVPQSAVRYRPNKREITAGESIVLNIEHEGERFGETFPLLVGPENIIGVSYELEAIKLTFELPGEYTLYVPDGRIYSRALTIRVREDVQ